MLLSPIVAGVPSDAGGEMKIITNGGARQWLVVKANARAKVKVKAAVAAAANNTATQTYYSVAE